MKLLGYMFIQWGMIVGSKKGEILIVATFLKILILVCMLIMFCINDMYNWNRQYNLNETSGMRISMLELKSYLLGLLSDESAAMVLLI